MRGNRRSPAFWEPIIRQFRLAWRLFNDRRVPFSAKLLPVFTLLYILSPLDLIPDMLVGLGQLDDLTIFVASVYMFIFMCPHTIVEQIRREMDDEDAIDGEPWSEDDEPPRLPESDN